MPTRRDFIGASVGVAAALRARSPDATFPRAAGSAVAAPLDALHDLFDKHCAQYALMGCAISVSFLTQSLWDGLSQIRDWLRTQRMPTSIPAVSLGLDLDPTAVNIAIQGTAILLEGLAPRIVLSESTGALREYRSTTVRFDRVELELAHTTTSEDALDLRLRNSPAPTSIQGPLDATVLADNGIAVPDFALLEAALLAAHPPWRLLQDLIGSIPVPGALQAMRTFGIGFERRFVAEAGYILVIGPSAERAGFPGCMGGVGIQYRTTRGPTHSPASGHPQGAAFSHAVEATFVEGQEALGGAIEAAFYYPKSTTFEILADSTVKPGFGVGDIYKGLAAIHFFYHATVALKDVGMSVTPNPATGRVEISAPYLVAGQAHAVLKLGWFSIPLPGASIAGEVDRSLFSLGLGITHGPAGPVLQTAASYLADVDIYLQSPFPIRNLIVNTFMAFIGNGIVAKRLAARASKLAVPLIDFGDLLPSVPASLAWRSSRSVRADSMVVAVGLGEATPRG